jgi:putative sigma-54 modulation protein
MNLTISGHHVAVTEALRDYVTQKLQRVRRHFDHVIDVGVILSVEKLRQKAEVTLHLRGKAVHCEAVHADLYAAIDELIDKLDRQVLKHKTQRQEHAHASSKRMSLMSEETLGSHPA